MVEYIDVGKHCRRFLLSCLVVSLDVGVRLKI